MSDSEEVRVCEFTHIPATSKNETMSLEVLYSSDGGKSWTSLPLRRSPWGWLRCILRDGGWPPESSRQLSCEGEAIALEFVSPDYWDNWPLKIWRATYQPRWRWWSLEVVTERGEHRDASRDSLD